MTAVSHPLGGRVLPNPVLPLQQRQLTLHANHVYEALLNMSPLLSSDLRLFRTAPGSLSSALIFARSLERMGQPAMILHTPEGHAWVASHALHVDFGRLVPEDQGVNVSVRKVAPTYDLRHPFQLRTDPSGHLAFDLPGVLEDEPTIRAFMKRRVSRTGAVRGVTAQWGGTLRLSCGHWVLGDRFGARPCPYCPQERPA